MSFSKCAFNQVNILIGDNIQGLVFDRMSGLNDNSINPYKCLAPSLLIQKVEDSATLHARNNSLFSQWNLTDSNAARLSAKWYVSPQKKSNGTSHESCPFKAVKLCG